MTCPVFKAADLIGKKWTIVLLQEVRLTGDQGFNAIFKRMKKVSPKILSQRLHELEQEGLIEKIVHSETQPERTSYFLTLKGRELENVIEQLKDWHLRFDAKTKDVCSQECVLCPLY